MIVECHDFVDPRTTSILVERLQITHEMVGVPEGPRNPNEFEFLQGLNSLDRWLAVCEFRLRSRQLLDLLFSNGCDVFDRGVNLFGRSIDVFSRRRRERAHASICSSVKANDSSRNTLTPAMSPTWAPTWTKLP